MSSPNIGLLKQDIAEHIETVDESLLRSAEKKWQTSFTPFSPSLDSFTTAVTYYYVITRVRERIEQETGTRIHSASDPVPELSLLIESFTPESSYDFSTGPEVLMDAHRELTDTSTRQETGSFYTPLGITDVLLDQLTVTPDDAVLDPGTGSGIFLNRLITRIIETSDTDPRLLLNRITESFVGIDIDPIAVSAATVSYASALQPLLDAVEMDDVVIPIYHGDVLGVMNTDPYSQLPTNSFDYIIGNPPWMTWTALPDKYRTRMKNKYGDAVSLTSHSGFDAQLGHVNDDFAIPFTTITSHRYLSEGGKLGAVIKESILSQPAGRLLRQNATGGCFGVQGIHTFPETAFPDISIRSAVIIFQHDEETVFPISVSRHGNGVGDVMFTPLTRADPASPWVERTAARVLGDCQYEIRQGVKDDADNVFQFTSRAEIPGIEQKRIYPSIRSTHITRFGIDGYDHRLIPVNHPSGTGVNLKEQYPDTYQYLKRNESSLDERQSNVFDSGPFYTVFGVGDYTWAPYKVAWCRLGHNPEFAVLSGVDDDDDVVSEKCIVPNDHFLYIPCQDGNTAHFLCSVLNSTPYKDALRSISSGGKASLSKGVVSQLSLPDWRNRPDFHELASLSRQAHSRVQQESETDVTDIIGEIDRIINRRIEQFGGDPFSDAGQTTLDAFETND